MTGDELRSLRERLGWSQRQMADVIRDATDRAPSSTSISEWERGRYSVPADVAAFMAALSDVDPDEIPTPEPARRRRGRPPKAEGDSAPASDGPDLRASDLILPSRPYSSLCEDFFDLIATGVGMVGAALGNPALQSDGLIIHARKQELGAAYGKLAETNEAFRNLITQTERQGAYLAVALVTGSTAGELWRNHHAHRVAQAPQTAEDALRMAREGETAEAGETEGELAFA